MAELTRFCPSCYARNAWALERCATCGAALDTDETFEERLIWALRHPDTAAAMLAATLLAERRAAAAIPALIDQLASADPYRAAAAAGALRAFPEDEVAKEALSRARQHEYAIVRRAAGGAGGPRLYTEEPSA